MGQDHRRIGAANAAWCRLPRGIGVARLCDAPAGWSRQYRMLGLPSPPAGVNLTQHTAHALQPQAACRNSRPPVHDRRVPTPPRLRPEEGTRELI